ncbi:RecQ family ATP-dependent DNA helicase [Lentibacillus sediminis]|uniref:RecQ family ATP-dependent DNA helicase n=1 Tax=Lentibacillus sediminis TaxID=1940529 RepID=UPI000C1C3695|nr:ATP-dependent DNA helicase RecQ [Lentibacillus sediminis]
MTEQVLEHQLKKYFAYDSFRPGQKEIIRNVLKGENVLGILPTGSGKSICYQLPARILPGITVVVSPLISLMMDQVKQLRATGFKEVVALNSFMDPAERKRVMNHLDAYKLIYISPELLQKAKILDSFKKQIISLLTVDEAHCISQWGHEFRPDYLKLDRVKRQLGNPPVLALSATATPEVQQDIVQHLAMNGCVRHVYPMDRENLSFLVQEAADDQAKQAMISEIAAEFHVPILIYFSSRNDAQEVASALADKLPDRRIAFYHGGMEQLDRISVQQQFMNSQLDLICCTSAFGMGIDKSDIRLVIHYHLPPQLESFIQEIGRAGRDGRRSVSLLLFSPKDMMLPKSFIQHELPHPKSIFTVFRQLKELFLAGGDLPHKEEETAQLFQLNEIQWRFLRQQLEKHGMIKGNRIFYNEAGWDDHCQAIKRQRDEREWLKESKLREMLEWIQEKGCLRRNLYKNFQASYRSVEKQCCSNCGFSFADWDPQPTARQEEASGSWEIKLKELLLS